MTTTPSLTYVVRQRITVPRHVERFDKWLGAEQIPALRKAIPELAGVRHYKEEKDELVRLTFYDFREGTSWAPRSRDSMRTIREAWHAFAPDMRDFTATPYQLIWEGGTAPTSKVDHPLIVERLSVLAEKEQEFDRWSEEMWEGEIRDLPLAAVQRYWTLVGDPRFYLQIQVFEDDETMRRKIKASEPKQRPAYWNAWASWMPHVENLSRYVFVPVSL